MNTTKIIKKITYKDFKVILTKCKNNIEVGPHASDHLSNAQRRCFEKKTLKNPLLTEKPELIGLQENERYSIYFKRKDGFLRVILALKESKLEIVTFMNTLTIPDLRDLK